MSVSSRLFKSYTLTPEQKKVLDKIKQDPCYTTDAKSIQHAEFCHFPYTVLTSSHEIDKILATKKLRQEGEVEFSVKTRLIYVDTVGKIHLLDKKHSDVSEELNEYVFSDEALRAVDLLKNKYGFTIPNKSSFFKDMLVLEHKNKPVEKSLRLRNEISDREVEVSPSSIEYLMQIDRKGNLHVFVTVKGEIKKDPIFRNGGYYSNSFPIRSIEDIPEERIRKIFRDENLQIYQNHHQFGLRARL